MCQDLSGEWAWSVLVPNYQPLRAGIQLARAAAPPPTPPTQVVAISAAAASLCIASTGSGTAVTLAPCNAADPAQLWEEQPVAPAARARTGGGGGGAGTGVGGEVRFVHSVSGACLDAGQARPGQAVYTHVCVPPGSIGQTWRAAAAGALVNVAAKTCASASAAAVSGGTVAMAACTGSPREEWAVANKGPALRPPPTHYYNVTSTREVSTHALA